MQNAGRDSLILSLHFYKIRLADMAFSMTFSCQTPRYQPGDFHLAESACPELWQSVNKTRKYGRHGASNSAGHRNLQSFSFYDAYNIVDLMFLNFEFICLYALAVLLFATMSDNLIIWYPFVTHPGSLLFPGLRSISIQFFKPLKSGL